MHEIITEFSNERKRMLEKIHLFNAETLGKTALHLRLNIPMRMVDSLYFVAEHDDHHLAIISNLLRTQENLIHKAFL